MEFEKNRLTLLPHEVSILSDADRRQASHPGKSDANSEAIKPFMTLIWKTEDRDSLRTLGAFSGTSLIEPESVIALTGQAIRKVPKALAVLARRALEHQQDMSNRYPGAHAEGAVKVRQELAEDLETLVANPKKVVLEVCCPDYPETDRSSS